MILRSISIFIPVRNEEKTLRDVVEKIRYYLDEKGIKQEILLLDDASCDSSLDIMKELSRRDPRIKYFHFSLPQGLGGMMKKGYSLAANEWVMMVSADGQFEPEYLGRYFARAGSADLVAGNRVDRYRFYSLARKLVSKAFNSIARYMFKVPVHDIGWTKMVKKDALRQISLKRAGAVVELELVAKLALKGFKISEVTTPYISRCSGKSKSFNAVILLTSFISVGFLYCEIARELLTYRHNKQSVPAADPYFPSGK